MPLNSCVVVDTDGQSRLVACALVAGESTEDYAWILEMLLEGNDGLAPGVIIVDEDPAMEAACAQVINETDVLNCIWHLGHQNLNKNLHGALGTNWADFISAFWVVRNAVTEERFEQLWQDTILPFGDSKERVRTYLGTVYGRRQHWAWPWVGTRFTAGMQSTQ